MSLISNRILHKSEIFIMEILEINWEIDIKIYIYIYIYSWFGVSRRHSSYNNSPLKFTIYLLYFDDFAGYPISFFKRNKML